MNQSHASLATCSSVPDSSNRCVAPGTTVSSHSPGIAAAHLDSARVLLRRGHPRSAESAPRRPPASRPQDRAGRDRRAFSPKVVRIGGRGGTFASTVGWRPVDNVVLMDVVMPTRAWPGHGRSGAAHAFQGVPFAASPFGAGRLRPPRLLKSWTGDRGATTAFVDRDSTGSNLGPSC